MSSLSFNKEDIEKDQNAISILSYMLTHEHYKVGRLLDTYMLSDLIDKITKANFEIIKFLPKNNLYVIRTYDLGYGYYSYLSPNKLSELMELGKIRKDLPIEFVYMHGNVFTFINFDDVDPNVLLTDEVHFLVKMETKNIDYGVIGKPTPPNFLYYKREYSGFKTTLDKARTIPYVNRIDMREKPIPNFI